MVLVVDIRRLVWSEEYLILGCEREINTYNKGCWCGKDKNLYIYIYIYVSVIRLKVLADQTYPPVNRKGNVIRFILSLRNSRK